MTKHYMEFRQHLTSRQLENLRATLKNRFTDGQLSKGRLTAIELGSEALYHVYVDHDREMIWLEGNGSGKVRKPIGHNTFWRWKA